MAETIANQFSGLDMHSLIAGPLLAACEAQSMLAASTAQFIQDVGLEKTDNVNGNRNAGAKGKDTETGVTK